MPIEYITPRRTPAPPPQADAAPETESEPAPAPESGGAPADKSERGVFWNIVGFVFETALGMFGE